MTSAVFLLAVSLLGSIEAQEPDHVFVERGSNLLLNVQKPVELNRKIDLLWKFNSSNTVAKCNYKPECLLYDEYEVRAEPFVQNYSFLLKNVRYNDSGSYVAVTVGGKDNRVAQYEVTVLDPVSPVQLTVTPVSSDPCDLNVTCSAATITRAFRCDTRSCLAQGEVSSEAGGHSSSLVVFLEQDSIICNHSNQVSSKQDKREIKDYCSVNSVSNGAIVAGVTIGALLIAIVPSVFLFRKYKRKRTVSAIPQDTDVAQTQSPPEDDSGPSLSSTYAAVKFHPGPAKPPRTKTTSVPETVYAVVTRAPPQPTPEQS